MVLTKQFNRTRHEKGKDLSTVLTSSQKCREGNICEPDKEGGREITNETDAVRDGDSPGG